MIKAHFYWCPNESKKQSEKNIEIYVRSILGNFYAIIYIILICHSKILKLKYADLMSLHYTIASNKIISVIRDYALLKKKKKIRDRLL